MPAKRFQCPDKGLIEIATCLSMSGCRMPSRCATRSFLALAGHDRAWKGVSPSAAGNGPRLLYLRATVDYTVDPHSRVWALLGTSVHEKIALDRWTDNILSEEKLSGQGMEGTADCLEEDEAKPGHYVLTDHKTWGSFKVAKALGIKSKTIEENVLDGDGKPLLLKSGPNKGQPKTIQKKTIVQDPLAVDLEGEELQINRYRIFFEASGFSISKMQIQAIPRDGGTYIATMRGINRNLYLIPIRRLLNADVLKFYKTLSDEVLAAFQSGYARKCTAWESWDRRRCDGFCEVKDACKNMSEKHNEKWNII